MDFSTGLSRSFTPLHIEDAQSNRSNPFIYAHEGGILNENWCKSFTTENMEEFIARCKSQTDLLPLYLDKIRNGEPFTEEMIENINNFDEKSKMKIILEYNKVVHIMKTALDK